MLYFVSSNKIKISNAKAQLAKFHIEIKPVTLDIQEIQSDTSELIALDKAEKAFDILKKPLLITDHGWAVHGLNGFPGPFMHYINNWFTPNNFLELTQNLTDRRVTLQEVVVYKDKTHTKLFRQDHTGELLKEIRGLIGQDPFMTIVSHIKGMSNIEARNKDINPIDSSKLWLEFSNWYKKSL